MKVKPKQILLKLDVTRSFLLSTENGFRCAGTAIFLSEICTVLCSLDHFLLSNPSLFLLVSISSAVLPPQCVVSGNLIAFLHHKSPLGF